MDLNQQEIGTLPLHTAFKADPIPFWQLSIQEEDSNLRPLGYEPNKLPLLHPVIWRSMARLNCQHPIDSQTLYHLANRPYGGYGGIRIHTFMILSHVPLPLGYIPIYGRGNMICLQFSQIILLLPIIPDELCTN